MINILKKLFRKNKTAQPSFNKITEEEISAIMGISHAAAVDTLKSVDSLKSFDENGDEYLVIYNEMLIMFNFLSTKLYIKHSSRRLDEIDAPVEIAIYITEYEHGQISLDEQDSIAKFTAAALYGYSYEAGHYIDSNDREKFAAASSGFLLLRLRKYHKFDTSRLNRKEISTELVAAYGALDYSFSKWPDLLRMARKGLLRRARERENK